eukprot:13505199-Ditylum_brightwellii.AAC.1
MTMLEVHEVVYAKHKEHGGHNIAYIILSIKNDTEFLVILLHHNWGEQVMPHHWIIGAGFVIDSYQTKLIRTEKNPREEQCGYDV